MPYCNALNFIAGVDYSLDSKTVTFPTWSLPGKTSVCCTLSIINDNVLENTEVYSISLVSNDTAAIISYKRSEITVYAEEDYNDSK